MGDSSKPSTLLELLHESVRRHPKRPALSMNSMFRTRTYTYEQLWDAAQRTSVLLARHGVHPGNSVLLLAPNSPYSVVLLLATLMRGAVFVPLNTQSTSDMIRSIAASCGARILFVGPTQTAPRNIDLETIPLATLPQLIEDYRLEDVADETITADTVAQIMYTSGTTGEPKGVVLTHKNMLTTILATQGNVPIRKTDRLLSILPLSHIYEQVVGLFLPLSVGAHVIYLHRPSALVPLLKEHRITKMAGVPEFLRILMSKIEQRAERENKLGTLRRLMCIAYALPSMRLRRLLLRSVHRALGGHLTMVASGGSPLDATLEQKWNSLGIELLQGYGLTEVSGVATMNTTRAHRTQSVGRPLSVVELRLAQDNEICLRGPSVFQGYYKRSDATAAVLDAEHWFHTGDIGEIDDDGFLFIRGRKKYMLKGAGGQNVYPEDIEHELDQEPEITDSCVIAITSNEHMLITAVVRLEDDAADLQSIQKRVNKRLASYQTVNQILPWPEHDFPRSASRKVKRDPVRQWAQDRLDGTDAATNLTNVSRLAGLLSSVTGMKSELIRPSAGLAQDLGLDSLMRVELVSRIELEFGALLDETKITNETTVQDLRTMIENAEPTVAQDPYVRWPLSWWANALRRFIVGPILFAVTHVFFRTEVHGLEHIQQLTGPCLFMPTHKAAVDSIALSRTLPPQLARRLSHAAGADIGLFHEYGRWTWLIRLWMNVFALPRKDGYAIADGLAYIGWMLDRGYSVCIFPEGDTKPGTTILPIKEGAALLASHMDVPVVPVYLTGVERVMRYQSIEIVGYRQRVGVWYGRPMHFSPSESNDEVRFRIALALSTLRNQALAHERQMIDID